MRKFMTVGALALGVAAFGGTARANLQNPQILFGRYTVSESGWYLTGYGDMYPQNGTGQLHFDGVNNVCGEIVSTSLTAPGGPQCTYIINGPTTKNTYDVLSTGIGYMHGVATPAASNPPECGHVPVTFVATLGVSSKEQFVFSANSNDSDQTANGVGLHQHGVSLDNDNGCL